MSFRFWTFSLDATVMLHNGEYYYIWAEKTGREKDFEFVHCGMERPDKLQPHRYCCRQPDYPVGTEWFLGE